MVLQPNPPMKITFTSKSSDCHFINGSRIMLSKSYVTEERLMKVLKEKNLIEGHQFLVFKNLEGHGFAVVGKL